MSKWLRVCAMLLLPMAASADLADQMESYVGYAIVSQDNRLLRIVS